MQLVLQKVVAANESLSKLTAGQQVIYEDVMDEFEDMRELTPVGRKSFIDLFVGRVTRIAMEHGIKKAVIDPAINDFYKALKAQIQF